MSRAMPFSLLGKGTTVGVPSKVTWGIGSLMIIGGWKDGMLEIVTSWSITFFFLLLLFLFAGWSTKDLLARTISLLTILYSLKRANLSSFS